MGRAKTWALVTNGVRARVLRGLEDGDGEFPVEWVGRAPSRRVRAMLSDRSGRRFAPGAAAAGAEAVRRDTRDFVDETLTMLEARRRAGDFERLAVIAIPQTMAILRRRLKGRLRASVCLMRTDDIARLPEPELRAAVLRLMGETPTDSATRPSGRPKRGFR